MFNSRFVRNDGIKSLHSDTVTHFDSRQFSANRSLFPQAHPMHSGCRKALLPAPMPLMSSTLHGHSLSLAKPTHRPPTSIASHSDIQHSDSLPSGRHKPTGRPSTYLLPQRSQGGQSTPATSVDSKYSTHYHHQHGNQQECSFKSQSERDKPKTLLLPLPPSPRSADEDQSPSSSASEGTTPFVRDYGHRSTFRPTRNLYNLAEDWETEDRGDSYVRDRSPTCSKCGNSPVTLQDLYRERPKPPSLTRVRHDQLTEYDGFSYARLQKNPHPPQQYDSVEFEDVGSDSRVVTSSHRPSEADRGLKVDDFISTVKPAPKRQARTKPPLLTLNAMFPGLEWEIISQGSVHRAVYTAQVTINGQLFSGCAMSKKLARIQCAESILEVLGNDARPQPGSTSSVASEPRAAATSQSAETSQQEEVVNPLAVKESYLIRRARRLKESGESSHVSCDSGKTPIQVLYERCLGQTLDFSMVSQTRSKHNQMEFTFCCSVNGTRIFGSAADKKSAKQAAARNALTELFNWVPPPSVVFSSSHCSDTTPHETPHPNADPYPNSANIAAHCSNFKSY